jgi:hypothetical protein
MNEKREILYQMERLAKKGTKLPKQFSLESNLADMRAELDRLQRDRDVDSAISFQRKMVMGAVTGIELLNRKFDPVGAKLDGWSGSVQENISELDDCLEELYLKYKGSAKMMPELRLLFTLGGSALVFHLSNTLFKNSPLGLDQILRDNPALAKQFASAAMNSMAGEQKQNGNPIGAGFAGFMSDMLGGAAGGGQRAEEPPRPTGRMRGPGGFTEMMNDLNKYPGQGPPPPRPGVNPGQPILVPPMRPSPYDDDESSYSVGSSVVDSEVSQPPKQAARGRGARGRGRVVAISL